MNTPTNTSIAALLGLDGFADYCDTNDFAAFELQLETDLLVLENRWAALAAPHASRSSRRGGKFPKPFELKSNDTTSEAPQKPR